MFRAALVIAAVIAAMVVLKDGRALEETGILSSCSAVAAPAGQPDGFWEACRAGKLEGYPDLKRRSCKSTGVKRGIEYWRCPEQIGSGPSAAGPL